MPFVNPNEQTFMLGVFFTNILPKSLLYLLKMFFQKVKPIAYEFNERFLKNY